MLMFIYKLKNLPKACVFVIWHRIGAHPNIKLYKIIELIRNKKWIHT